MQPIAIFAAVATVAGGLGAVGLSLPQIATKDEVASVLLIAESNRETILLDQISRLNLDLRLNLTEQDTYRAKGQPIPRGLIENQNFIESLILQKQRDLKKLRQ